MELGCLQATGKSGMYVESTVGGLGHSIPTVL